MACLASKSLPCLTRASSCVAPATGPGALLDSAVSQYVLPLAPALLEEEDPMPLYALKLLGILLELNPGWVAQLVELGLATRWGGGATWVRLCLGLKAQLNPHIWCYAAGFLSGCPLKPPLTTFTTSGKGLLELAALLTGGTEAVLQVGRLRLGQGGSDTLAPAYHGPLLPCRICRLIAQSGTLPAEQLVELGVMDRVRGSCAAWVHAV